MEDHSSWFIGGTLGEKIAYNLRFKIINGTIKKGVTLSENQIAKEYGTSRSPVREALKTLENEGIIQLERMGAIVLGLTTKNLHELYDVRLLIENFAIMRLGSSDCEEIAKRLHMIIDKMEMAAKHKDSEEFSRYDLIFHETIIRESEHTRIFHLWKSIRQIVLAALMVATEKRFSSKAHQIDPLIQKHRVIVEALVAGKQEMMEEAVNEHFEDTRKTVDESISKGD
ncbi:GntR family transcriptional regulator [Sediminibacillus massiliensis]|uniref:GntR family transcriptional regulator n=1 Tax=Sediminibacillus massiliensis TaxID=1926277 RepID=UPI0009888576|nr:GntR family transcriptional regulator [Sediminibacillus massiliensis]